MRGTLCPALKALFEHGLKKPSLLGGACHPWLFIEEVSQGLGPCPSLSSSLRPVELAAGAGGVATGPQLDSGFDLVAPLGSLTLTPPRRQRAGRSRETSTPCIRAWCCVRRTGNLVPLAGSPGSLGWGWRSGPNPPDSVGSFRAPPPASRLDEDGKVLTPEELLYRVRGAVGGAGLLGQQLGTPA